MTNTELSNLAPKSKREILAFAIGLSYISFSGFIDMLFTTVIGQNFYDSLLSLGITAGLLFLVFWDRGFRIQTKYISFILLLYAVIFMDLLNPNANLTKWDLILSNFTQKAIGGFVFATLLKERLSIKKGIHLLAIITFFSSVAIPFMPTKIQALYDTGGMYGAYMLFGYRMAGAVIFLFYTWKDIRKRLYLVLAIVGLIEVLIYGNRGAVICILAYLVLSFLKSQNRKKWNMLIPILTVFGMACFLDIPSFLQSLLNNTTTAGITSRNLTLLLSRTEAVSGRHYIYEMAYKMIEANPIFGYGLSGSWMFGGNIGYVHNIFLEMALNFGVLLGGAILLCFLLKSLSLIFMHRDSEWSEIYLAFFSIGFVKLLFSGSYWIEWWPWAMVGMMFVCNKGIKMESEYVCNSGFGG